MSIATVLKLAMSTVLHDSARIHAQPLGQEAILVGGASEAGELANQEAIWSFVTRSAAAATTLSANLIGERLPDQPCIGAGNVRLWERDGSNHVRSAALRRAKRDRTWPLDLAEHPLLGHLSYRTLCCGPGVVGSNPIAHPPT